MKSIRAKILVFVLSVIVAAFVVIGVITYLQVSKNVNAVTVDLSGQISGAIAGEIDEVIHGLMNRVESAALQIGQGRWIGNKPEQPCLTCLVRKGLLKAVSWLGLTVGLR